MSVLEEDLATSLLECREKEGANVLLRELILSRDSEIRMLKKELHAMKKNKF
jgi:hypothetical protein